MQVLRDSRKITFNEAKVAADVVGIPPMFAVKINPGEKTSEPEQLQLEA